MRHKYGVCNFPGCPEITSEGGACPTHRAAKRKGEGKQRTPARKRGYDAHWERTRRSFLELYPLCAKCGNEANIVHHLNHLGPLGSEGHDFHNLEALCSPCHTAHHNKARHAG